MTWETIREVTACTGHCCRAFQVGLSPVELGQKVIAARKAGLVDGVLDPDTVSWISEALVYLGEHEASPSGYDNVTAPPVEPGWKREAAQRPRYWFTCRHLQDDRCAIYNERPDVCREYPYRDNDCHNSDCTRRAVMAEGLSWWRQVEPEELVLKAVVE
jgi:Fe-S-cluster containining protein